MSLSVIICDSLEKVFPDETPRPLDPAIPLVGHAGERASFQVAIRPDRTEKLLTLNRPRVAVRAPGGVTVRLSQVELVPVSLPGLWWVPAEDHEYLRTEPGLFPDVLRPLPPGQPPELPLGRWGSVWVTLEFAGSVPSGEGTVEVEVGEDPAVDPDATPHTTTLRLLTVAGGLPALGIVNTHWFHCDSLVAQYGLEPYSERYWEIVGNFLQGAARMSVNSILTPVWTPPVDTEVGGTRLPSQLLGIADDGDGAYRFETSRLEHWLDAVRAAGIERLEIPHLFTQAGAHFTPAIYVDTPTGVEQRFGWHVAATDPSYRALLEQMLPFLISFLEERWGLDKVVFHIADEPTEEHLGSYGAARATVADLLEGVTVVDALSSIAFYESGLVPVPVASTNHADPFLAEGVRPLWVYYCISQAAGVSNRFIAQPSARNRALGAQLYAADVQGFLHWGFNYYNNQRSTRHVDPYLDPCAGGAYPGGDPFIVYPGADGKPVPSIRYEVFYEAMLDHRVAQALEERYGRGRALELLGLTDAQSLALGEVHPDDLLRRAARGAEVLADL